VNPGPARGRIVDWLLREIAQRLKVDPSDIDVDMAFADMGLDSVESVSLTFELGEWAGCALPDTLLWEYPTIHAVAGYVASVSGLNAVGDAVAKV
jgi:acyl carrier protein